MLLAVLLGIVLAIAAFKAVRYMETQNIHSEFHLDAQERITAIRREIDTNLEAVQSLHSFYEASEKVTREEFRKFTVHLITRHPSIRAVEWIPRVSLQEKGHYENEAGIRFPGFRITEQNERGMFVTARKRAEYFPVYFAEPERENEVILGFDVFSEPRRRAALMNARNSGAMAATGQITLVRERGEKHAFLVFVPVYRKGSQLSTVKERITDLNGFVVGVFEIGDIVESALAYLEPVGIDIYLYDVSDSHQDSLYEHLTRLPLDAGEKEMREVKGKDTYYLENTFHVADKTWKAVAVLVEDYIGEAKDLHAWTTAGGVIMLMLIVVLYLKKVSDQAVYSAGLIKKLEDEIIVRREVETALVDREREFRSLFENMNEAFAYHKMIYDEKNRPVDYEFIAVNEVFEKTTGLKREETAGKRVTELIPGIRDAKPDLIDIYGNIALTGEGKKFELFFEPFDKWYFVNAYSPGKDHFVTVFEDITERKKFEIERERLLTELSMKNRELEQILYVTSHDLRSPLVNVEGFGRELQYSMQELTRTIKSLEIPEDEKKAVTRIVTEEVPESMTYISKSIAKMDAMLKGLLKLSRLGRHEITVQEIDMNALIDDVISNFEFTLKNAGIRVTVSALPPCRGDSGQINQVFSNIIDNAVKYLDPERPGMIAVSANGEGEYSVYCVEDNGIGIEPKHQEKIFKLFQQLEPGEDRGEGLGLTIAHRIVERHHGKLWVESEPGKGSRFYVQLPA